jgi:mRNA interferase MazF
VDVVADRFAVYLVPLDPTTGSEIGKTRPCVVVSPDVINRLVRKVIVAPLTSTMKHFPYRVTCKFAGRQGQIALDQVRTIDKSRLIKRLGNLDAASAERVTATLVEMFR